MARRQMMLRKEDLNLFKKLGRQEEKGPQATVVARFFHPNSAYTFYATEYDEKDQTFFGYGGHFQDEWGYTSLQDLQTPAGRFNLPCERDKWFTPKALTEALKEDRKVYPVYQTPSEETYVGEI